MKVVFNHVCHLIARHKYLVFFIIIFIVSWVNDSGLSSAHYLLLPKLSLAVYSNSNTRSSKSDYYSNCLLGFVEEDADVEWQESWIEKKKGKV